MSSRASAQPPRSRRLQAQATHTKVPRWRIGLLAFGVLLAIGAVMLGRRLDLETIQTWAASTGPWFPVVFFLAYVVITQFPIPRTLFTLSAGVLFGVLPGIALALAATTTSSAVALLLGRSVIAPVLAPRLRHPSFDRINAHLHARGWLAVISLRMIAAVPFSVLNYAASLTSLSVGQFALATLVGSAPGTVITVALGESIASGGSMLTLGLTVILAAFGIIGLVLDARLPLADASFARTHAQRRFDSAP